jgi:hypothetical protein
MKNKIAGKILLATILSISSSIQAKAEDDTSEYKYKRLQLELGHEWIQMVHSPYGMSESLSIPAGYQTVSEGLRGGVNGRYLRVNTDGTVSEVSTDLSIRNLKGHWLGQEINYLELGGVLDIGQGAIIPVSLGAGKEDCRLMLTANVTAQARHGKSEVASHTAYRGSLGPKATAFCGNEKFHVQLSYRSDFVVVGGDEDLGLHHVIEAEANFHDLFRVAGSSRVAANTAIGEVRAEIYPFRSHAPIYLGGYLQEEKRWAPFFSDHRQGGVVVGARAW